MRIAVISSCVFACPPSGYAGLEMIAHQCATGLAKLGHKVTLIAPDGSHCEGGEVLAFGPPGQWDEKHAYRVYRDSLSEFDVIIDHSWMKFSYIAKAEERTKAHVLGVLHAPVNTMYQSLPPVEKPCMVCISRDQANHYEALFGREARVCHNGIDLDFYKPMGIKRTDRFLFLARFSSVKSPDVCQDVCINTGVGLDLVGDTSITNEPEYLRLCMTKADGKQIKIIGGVNRSETVYWYSQAKALLHLTPNFREPFGLGPVEAMATGCPVLAWRRGAMKETVNHGESGFIVNSVSEVEELIRSDAISKINRVKCREWASQFSVENMVNRYEQLCNESLSTGGW